MKISDLKFTGKLEIEGFDVVTTQFTNASFDFVLDYIEKHLNCGEKPANKGGEDLGTKLPSTEQNKNGRKRKKDGHKIVAENQNGVIASFQSKNEFLIAIGYKDNSITLNKLLKHNPVNGWTIIRVNGKDIVRDVKPEVDENGQLSIPFNSEKRKKKNRRVSVKKDGCEPIIFENVNSAADYYGVSASMIYNRIPKPGKPEKPSKFWKGDEFKYTINWVH